MLKRICSFIIVAAMMCSLFSTSYAADDKYKYFSETDILGFNRQLGFLEATGVLSTTRGMDISSTITRGDFAQMLVKLMNAEASLGIMGNSAFNDASGNMADVAGYVVYAGLMKSENGMFRPDDALTYNEAVFALVNLLGYNILAEENSGSPAAYELMAKKIGILGSNDVYGDYPVTLGVLFDMIENSLDVDFFGKNLNGRDYAVMTGRTIMSEYLKAEKHSGILYGTAYSHIIRANGPGEGCVEIDGKVYQAIGEYDEYLGMSVDYYTREVSGVTKVIYIIEGTRNKVLKINAEDISAYSKVEYTYYDGEDEKTVKLSSECLTVYNNSANSAPTDAERIPESGYIQLIDNDDDSKYDILKIVAYEHYIAGSVDVEELDVFDKYTPSRKLDLTKTECVRVYMSNGTKTEFAKIQKDDVLTVVANYDNSIVDIFVSRNIVEGTVTKVTSDNDGTVYTIGGQEYRLARGYVGGDTIGVMKQGIFRLNTEGRIVAFEKNDGIQKLGYLVRVVIDNDVPFNEELRFRLFSEDGDMIIAPMANSVKIDGKSYKTAQSAYSALLKGYDSPQCQVVQYRMTDGVIEEITTAYNKTAATESVDPLTVQPPEGREKSSLRLLRAKGSHYSSVLKTVGNVGISGSTIVFEVPEDAAMADDDQFGVSSGMNSQTNISCEIYSNSDTNLVASAIVKFGEATGKTRVGVVSAMEGVLDPNGVPCTKITILYYPQSTDVVLAYDGMEEDAVGMSDGKVCGVGVGDVVEYTIMGRNNKAEKFFILCDASEKQMDRVKFTNPYGHISYDLRRYSYGALNECSNGFYQLSFCNPWDYTGEVPSELTELYTSSGFYCIEVDTSGRETVVKRTDSMTGRDYKKYYKDCDYAFVALEYGYTRIIVVYK